MIIIIIIDFDSVHFGLIETRQEFTVRLLLQLALERCRRYVIELEVIFYSII